MNLVWSSTFSNKKCIDSFMVGFSIAVFVYWRVTMNGRHLNLTFHYTGCLMKIPKLGYNKSYDKG